MVQMSLSEWARSVSRQSPYTSLNGWCCNMSST
nr:MAG TPA: hypothetical protein [Caudoviricetes sp.]